jgi:hypothetical protein
LLYAYAEAVLAAGDDAEARGWFAKALDADAEGQTDAADRLAELDGIVLTDVLDGVETTDAEDPSMQVLDPNEESDSEH